jgi:hypothetical protein
MHNARELGDEEVHAGGLIHQEGVEQWDLKTQCACISTTLAAGQSSPLWEGTQPQLVAQATHPPASMVVQQSVASWFLADAAVAAAVAALPCPALPCPARPAPRPPPSGLPS